MPNNIYLEMWPIYKYQLLHIIAHAGVFQRKSNSRSKNMYILEPSECLCYV